jgi:hypothetical protein
MTEIQIKTSDVTEFLKHCVDLTMHVYTVDDDGYVMLTSDDKKVELGSDKKNIVLYQEKIEDNNAYVLNPFSEGLSDSPPDRWFYTTMRMSLVHRIGSVLQMLVHIANEDRKFSESTQKQKTRPPKHPSVISRIASKIVKNVDDKLVDETDKFVLNADDVLNVIYSKRLMAHRIRIPLLENDVDFPKSVRKQSQETWLTILKLLFEIDTTEDLDKYTVKAREDATPKIDSFMGCIYLVYKQFNEIFDVLSVEQRMSVDLTEFKHHIDRMSAYSKNAKGMISYVATAPKVNTNTHPASSVPVPSMGHLSTVPSGEGGTIPGTTVPIPRGAEGAFSQPPYNPNGYMGPQLPVHHTPGGVPYGASMHQMSPRSRGFDPISTPTYNVSGPGFETSPSNGSMGGQVRLNIGSVSNGTPGMPHLRR